METNPTDPDDVHLYTSPWVGGTRAESYHGPIMARVEYVVKEDLEKAITEAVLQIQSQCASLGGNSVVGVEITIDPFANPAYVAVIGTSAKLVPLFA